MRRLLQNLVSNAIKYTLRGKVLVGCRRAGGRCGSRCGTPASAFRPTSSAPCSRSSSGSTRARGWRAGLGLGLSIVERLGRVLGHPVGLESRPGAGSVFSVTAPLGARVRGRADDGAPPRLSPASRSTT